MKRTTTRIAAALFAALAWVSTAYADDDGRWGWHEHEHHHHHGHHGHGWERGYYPPPGYYAAPPPAVRPYYGPPQVVYREVPVYREPPAYPRRQSRIMEAVPIAAGGVLGGMAGHEIGGGSPAATIGGAVLGSVLGHEIAR